VKAFTGRIRFWTGSKATRRGGWRRTCTCCRRLDPESVPSSWQLWEVGPPSFALEVVSRDVGKDDEDAPTAYAAMGAKELVIFDPGATARSRARVRWRVYRRLARRGFVRVAQTMSDRVQVASLGCWLRAMGEGRDARLRLGTGVGGEGLFMTEPAEAQAQAAEASARGERRGGDRAAAGVAGRARVTGVPRSRGGCCRGFPLRARCLAREDQIPQ